MINFRELFCVYLVILLMILLRGISLVILYMLTQSDTLQTVAVEEIKTDEESCHLRDDDAHKRKKCLSFSL